MLHVGETSIKEKGNAAQILCNMKQVSRRRVAQVNKMCIICMKEEWSKENRNSGILTATPCSGSLCDYLTLSSLLEPLLTYFGILTAYAALSGDMLATLTVANGCNAYTSHLLALSHQFQWTVILQYHKSYFLSWHCEMARGDYSGWLHPDLLLMTEHVYGHPHVQNHPSSSKSNCPASNSTKQPVPGQTCFAFNKGSCNSLPCPNGHIHKCQKCKGTDHGVSNCNKST